MRHVSASSFSIKSPIFMRLNSLLIYIYSVLVLEIKMRHFVQTSSFSIKSQDSWGDDFRWLCHCRLLYVWVWIELIKELLNPNKACSLRLAEYVSAGRGFSGDDVLRDSSLTREKRCSSRAPAAPRCTPASVKDRRRTYCFIRSKDRTIASQTTPRHLSGT